MIVCMIYCRILTNNPQRSLYSKDEPTPEDLFGVLGIFPSFCESKVGGTFKKCQTPAPVSVPQMMMGKGKGGARRKVAVLARDDKLNEDIIDAFNALSSDDKKRLLVAIEHDDVNMVDSILEYDNQDGKRALQRNVGIDEEPTPEELFGVLGIFPSFCEGKIGKKLVKCLTKPPTPAPVGKGKMESMMGKRTRRVRDVFEDDVADELLQLYNTMTLHDKKRLLVAIDKDDEELMDELLTQYHHRFG